MTDGQRDDGQSDTEVALCFAGATKTRCPRILFWRHKKIKGDYYHDGNVRIMSTGFKNEKHLKNISKVSHQ